MQLYLILLLRMSRKRTVNQITEIVSNHCTDDDKHIIESHCK